MGGAVVKDGEFLYVDANNIDYYRAEGNCKLRNMQLAVLSSRNSFNSVTEHIANTNSSSRDWWIGLRRLPNETDITWVDGTSFIESEYTYIRTRRSNCFAIGKYRGLRGVSCSTRKISAFICQNRTIPAATQDFSSPALKVYGTNAYPPVLTQAQTIENNYRTLPETRNTLFENTPWFYVSIILPSLALLLLLILILFKLRSRKSKGRKKSKEIKNSEQENMNLPLDSKRTVPETGISSIYVNDRQGAQYESMDFYEGFNQTYENQNITSVPQVEIESGDISNAIYQNIDSLQHPSNSDDQLYENHYLN